MVLFATGSPEAGLLLLAMIFLTAMDAKVAQKVTEEYFLEESKG